MPRPARLPRLRCAWLLWLAAGPLVASETVNPQPAAPAPRLSFELPDELAAALPLRGDASWQLLLSWRDADGNLQDATRLATYRFDPPGVAAIDSEGRLTPLANGRTRLVAQHEGVETSLEIVVERFGQPPTINFANDVVPIFTRLGCNAGGCHGKSGGQNGFRLSLLGFEPADDYEFLTREDRGRRLFPAAPARSLLLQKATNAVPHGGGQRLDPDSPEYRVLLDWIRLGMPQGSSLDPQVASLHAVPASGRLGRESEQQIVILARFTDGSYTDVTRLATLESTDAEMLEVLPGGRVRALGHPGSAAAMARFQGLVAVFHATIPLGQPVDSLPEPANLIDELAFARLRSLGLPPSPLSDDATFLRRVTLDITGRLPRVEEAQAFLVDSDPQKRSRWIDSLLDSPEYADWFAAKWSAVLRNKRGGPESTRGTLAFHRWISQALYENLPYDQFVRRIVTASGDPTTDPPVVWYREVRDTTQRVEDVSQLFLGVRIQCARCHHHPFERWSQADYHRLAAFFSRVSKKEGSPGEDRFFAAPGAPSAKHPRTGQSLPPAGLGSAEMAIAEGTDPREHLANWMTDPANPFFARALVNRYWKHFFGRAFVEPEDDLRATNPASNEELLSALAQQFAADGYDLKQLVRLICNSRTYQLASEPNAHNLRDSQAYSRHYPQRLPAEALLDAVDTVTGARSDFAGAPIGTRAVSLPDQAAESYFLTVFGKPQADTACECERSQEASLAQSLHLLNSPEVLAKLSADNGRAAQLAADASRTNADKVAELYLAAFSRRPTSEETAAALAHLDAHSEQPRQAWEDLFWAVINTKEFLFNH